jgi:hypothetical protein
MQGKRIERFAEPAGERRRGPRAPPVLARRDVDHGGVAEHGPLPVLGFHHLGRALHHQCEFRLVHEDPRHSELRQHDGVARADYGVGVLHEHVERARLALGVLPVIGDAGQNFARPR